MQQDFVLYFPLYSREYEEYVQLPPNDDFHLIINENSCKINDVTHQVNSNKKNKNKNRLDYDLSPLTDDDFVKIDRSDSSTDSYDSVESDDSPDTNSSDSDYVYIKRKHSDDDILVSKRQKTPTTYLDDNDPIIIEYKKWWNIKVKCNICNNEIRKPLTFLLKSDKNKVICYYCAVKEKKCPKDVCDYKYNNEKQCSKCKNNNKSRYLYIKHTENGFEEEKTCFCCKMKVGLKTKKSEKYIKKLIFTDENF